MTAAADGYPFQTDLDLDPNVGGRIPLSQTELLERALREDWDVAKAHAELDAYAARHRTDAASPEPDGPVGAAGEDEESRDG